MNNPTIVANYVLEISFKEKIYIRPRELYLIIGKASKIYEERTGKKFLYHGLEVDETGNIPDSHPLRYKFDCFGRGIITKYSRNAGGEVLVIRDPESMDAVRQAWNWFKLLLDIATTSW